MINSSVIPEPHYIPAMWPLLSSMIFSYLCFYTCCYRPTVPPFCSVSYLKILSPNSSSSIIPSVKLKLSSSSSFFLFSLLFSFSSFPLEPLSQGTVLMQTSLPQARNELLKIRGPAYGGWQWAALTLPVEGVYPARGLGLETP